MGEPSHGGRERPHRPDGYPSDLEREVVSAEKLHFWLRPIRPDDDYRLVDFHENLSDRSCYLRFFSLHPHLSAKEVERFTHVDYVDRLALVAELDGRLIGVGRYDRHAGTDEAEVAFVVADDYQHHGIGSLLLDELAAAARDRGIAIFLADTLEENRTMMGVFVHSGFPVTHHCEYGTESVRFPIAPTPDYEAALKARRAICQVVPATPPPSAAPGAEGADAP
jgi:GNAT superfamily N-acetyltransferase